MNNLSRTHSCSALISLLKLEEGVFPPAYLNEELEYYLFERYANNFSHFMLKAYYRTRPFIPRSLQLFVRRRYARLQSAHIRFPAWPVEPKVVQLVDDSLQRVLETSENPVVHRISPWPERKRFSFVITHDVEGLVGLRYAPTLAALEEKNGFVSSWNLVPELYPIDWKIVEELKSAGGEIGVHGLKHDGREFETRSLFEKRLGKMNQYARQWGACGFRAPSTLRNVDWMPELDFDYDCSFHDSDPYEPQPGGCCCIWPYFIKGLVELPITLPQDHTLFEILGHRDISVWTTKADWIERHSGMVLIDVHPDYLFKPELLSLYEAFLAYMKGKSDLWHVLPRDMARWWRQRAASSLVKTALFGQDANQMCLPFIIDRIKFICDHVRIPPDSSRNLLPLSVYRHRIWNAFISVEKSLPVGWSYRSRISCTLLLLESFRQA